MDDMQLLRLYVERADQQAFSQLVARHIDWVYGVCQRQVRNPALAEDVTQAVFIVLAKKAPTLPEQTVLAGWLVQTARYAATDALKSEARRRRHEREAAAMYEREHTSTASSNDQTADLMSSVDAAMAKLSRADRDALALRFYQHKTLAEVGACLGLSEEAGKKRVSRGLNRLRELLGVRAVGYSAAGLASVMLANTASAAPAGLQATVTTTAIAGTPGIAKTIALGTMQTMAWAKVVHSALITAGIAAGISAGAAVYHLLPTTPTAAPAPPAPAPITAAATAPAVIDDSFVLTDGGEFSRRIDRSLLRFEDSGGAYKQFSLVVALTALPELGETKAEAVVERREQSIAVLVRSSATQLPFAFSDGHLLVLLDEANPGSLVLAEGLAPRLSLTASNSDADPKTSLTLTTGATPLIHIDVASLVEQLQRSAVKRVYEPKVRMLQLTGTSAGGVVLLPAESAPMSPPINQYFSSGAPRVAIGVRNLRATALPDPFPTVSLERLQTLNLPIRKLEPNQAAPGLIPTPGLFDNPAHRAAATKLKTLLQRREPPERAPQ